MAALAIETGVALPSLPSSMVSAAEAAGLPLIQLRKVVPFVSVMQAINSSLVSESVSQLRQADEASHAMAVELAHGGSLDRILAVLAGITHAEVTLASLTGATLASAAPAHDAADAACRRPGAAGVTGVTGPTAESAPTPEDHARLIHIDVPVRGILAAQLLLRVPPGEDENLARTAGKRSVDILALAMLQRMSPGLREVAGAALIRAIDSGSQPWRLQQLASAAGIPVSAPLVAVVVRSEISQQLRASVEQHLARVARSHATYVDNAELLAVASLAGEASEASRQVSWRADGAARHGRDAGRGRSAGGRDCGCSLVSGRSQAHPGIGGLPGTPGRDPTAGTVPSSTPRCSPSNVSPFRRWTRTSDGTSCAGSWVRSWTMTHNGIRGCSTPWPHGWTAGAIPPMPPASFTWSGSPCINGCGGSSSCAAVTRGTRDGSRPCIWPRGWRGSPDAPARPSVSSGRAPGSRADVRPGAW